jgi:response regulator of citrate/malate metabolism
MEATREQLHLAEAAYRQAVEALQRGESIGDTLDIISADMTRSNLNGALTDLEHSRHRARLAVLAGGIDEGLSVSELGRKMGISRQLASRYAQEIVDADKG